MQLKHILLAIAVLPSALCTFARGVNADSLLQERKSRETVIAGKMRLLDAKTPAGEVEKLLFIPQEHPAEAVVAPSVVEAVAARNRLLAKDSLSSAELFWVLRPYLLWAQHIDPHLRIEPQPKYAQGSEDKELRVSDLPVPEFRLLQIHDTLVVSQTVSPLFEKGDQILSINGTPAAEYLQYGYDDRHLYPFTLLANYHYELVTATDFRIKLLRNGRMLELTTPGTAWSKVYSAIVRQREFRSELFSKAQAGYFAIPRFYPNNNLLIKNLRKAILQAKKQGCTAFILDLRGNLGGSGADFDRLLSIFIDRPMIPYLKSERLRVSKQTLGDYEFLADSLVGQLITLPESVVHKQIQLDPKLYIPSMRYYVLMDKDTGSIAASFCNVLQYNRAAKLVGEPLMHNALKYGEVVSSWHYLTFLMWRSLSTVEFEEFSRADNSILMPDIPIPYIAADFLSGKDALLEALLAYLKVSRGN